MGRACGKAILSGAGQGWVLPTVSQPRCEGSLQGHLMPGLETMAPKCPVQLVRVTQAPGLASLALP